MRQILAKPGPVWLTALIAHHVRGTYYPVGHQRKGASQFTVVILSYPFIRLAQPVPFSTTRAPNGTGGTAILYRLLLPVRLCTGTGVQDLIGQLPRKS